mgnify:CR=1 FL=1
MITGMSYGALSLNANTVVLVVAPGAEVGSPARVALETPVKGYVEIEDNEVTLVVSMDDLAVGESPDPDSSRRNS